MPDLSTDRMRNLKNARAERFERMQEQIQSIYTRAGRACSDKKQSHLREFEEAPHEE